MKQDLPEDIIIDTLLERPVRFTIDRKHFSMPPVTLGKSLIIGSLVKKMGVDSELLASAPVVETMRLASTEKRLSARIIAVACAAGKEEALGSATDRRAEYFASVSTEDRAALLNTALSYDRTRALWAHFGIDKEMDRMRKAVDAKEGDSSLSFCGKSMWGQLIDPICERYGWTMDYVMWGISYTNLQMLAADQVKTLYLSEEERRKAHVAGRGDKVHRADNMTEAELKQVLGIKG